MSSRVSRGYRILRRFENGVVTTGEREVVSEEAALVRRIFTDYLAGASPKQIAKALNAEGVRGPQGALWSPSTIHGNPKRGTGIPHNELYVRRLVWNRQRFLRDPKTGKRVARPNPQSEWITKTVPELRIIDDELWQGVQARYATRVNHRGRSRSRRKGRADRDRKQEGRTRGAAEDRGRASPAAAPAHGGHLPHEGGGTRLRSPASGHPDRGVPRRFAG